MSNETAETYRFASLRQRLYETVIVVVACAVAGGIAAAIADGVARAVILGLAVASAGWGTWRAFRLEFIATSDRISIRNYWRAYDFAWADVTDVGLGTLTMGVIPQTAVGFLLRSGKGARAQATPPNPSERAAMFEALKRLAPASVAFHADL
jgi:hypothetical protein